MLVKAIGLYQKYLSNNHGPLRHSKLMCPFEPSCSEYTKQAIIKNGSIKGICIGLIRVLKCNPLSQSYKQAIKERMGD